MSRPLIDYDPDYGYQIRYNRHPKRKNNFKVGEMYDCYKDGMSLATIGKLYGCTRQSVYEIFKKRRYKLRSKKLKGAVIVAGTRYTPDGQGYLRGTKDGKRVYLHKLNWIALHGPIPAGFQLHFKGEKLNCDPSNLELVATSEMGTIFNPEHHNQYSKLSPPTAD